MYSPFPSLSCIPNLFTGKNIGWYGSNITLVLLPIIIGGLIISYLIVYNRYVSEMYLEPLIQYLMLIPILQFPLGSLSLSSLACSYDPVTNSYYMISQQWLKCHITSPIQIVGILGVVFYLLAIPVILHYWYWNSNFLESVKKHIGGLILPAGCREDVIFLSFVTTRSIILALVVSVIPASWNISDLIIFLILGVNIIIVLDRRPYEEQEFKTETENGGKTKMIVSGETLEVVSIFFILTSVLLLDIKSDILPLVTKSIFVGVVNFIYILYFVFGIIFVPRIEGTYLGRFFKKI